MCAPDATRRWSVLLAWPACHRRSPGPASRVATTLRWPKDQIRRLAVLTAATGGVPVWFGLDLYEYQQLGVHAALAGRSLVAVPREPERRGRPLRLPRPRHGTRTGTRHRTSHRRATGAGIGAVNGRTLIVVPPVVLTHWARETVRSHLGVPDPTSKAAWWPRDILPADGSPAADCVPAEVVVVQPGRRMPALPKRGVLIVADSILASRPPLVDEIVSWSPSVVVYDEAHRARTWTSTRSQTIRGLITRIRDTRTAAPGLELGRRSRDRPGHCRPSPRCR